ncbi:hypothetical protein [Anaerosporobacter sp.]|uniref:hypothetical protein n=1 Tax=Anaerosporobacter sp. TaxID=1872529 RepID=UPI00286EBADE|nr:hypothetical protein [Anaerosporobacter sp.]
MFVRKNQKQNKTTIAMIGTLSGVGVTYAAISFATYLTYYGNYRVALIEGNESMHFSYIRRAASIKRTTSTTEQAEYFRVGGIDYYPSSGEEPWLQLQAMPYDYVLVDYGTYEEARKNQYARCNYRFLIGSLCEWKREGYEAVLQKEVVGVKMDFCLATLGLKYDMKDFNKEFAIKLYGIPCIYDPFVLVKEVIQFWRSFSI